MRRKLEQVENAQRGSVFPRHQRASPSVLHKQLNRRRVAEGIALKNGRIGINLSAWLVIKIRGNGIFIVSRGESVRYGYSFRGTTNNDSIPAGILLADRTSWYLDGL